MYHIEYDKDYFLFSIVFVISIIHGRLTQLVECHLDVVKVGGSSPSSPTTISKIEYSWRVLNFVYPLLFYTFTFPNPDYKSAYKY